MMKLFAVLQGGRLIEETADAAEVAQALIADQHNGDPGSATIGHIGPLDGIDAVTATPITRLWSNKFSVW